MKYTIDDLDRKIIKLLSLDGRMSFTEIASQLNVTEKTVRLRYKSLIESQILEVVGVVNPIAFGLKAGGIIQLKVKPERIKEAVEALKTFREVRYVTLTSGPYSLLLQIAVTSQEEMTETVLKINEIPYITEMNTIVQLEVFKNTFQYI